MLQGPERARFRSEGSEGGAGAHSGFTSCRGTLQGSEVGGGGGETPLLVRRRLRKQT